MSIAGSSAPLTGGASSAPSSAAPSSAPKVRPWCQKSHFAIPYGVRTQLFACDPAMTANHTKRQILKARSTGRCSELQLVAQPAHLLPGPCNLGRAFCSNILSCSDLRRAPPGAIASCSASVGCARLACLTGNLHITDSSKSRCAGIWRCSRRCAYDRSSAGGRHKGGPARGRR